MNPTLVGAAKSKTIWAAVAIELISNIAPLLPDLFAQLGLSPHTVRIVGSFVGLVMVMLRTVTNASLADKGSPELLPPPKGIL